MDDGDLPPPGDIPAVSAEESTGGQEHGEGRRYPSTVGGLLYLAVLCVLLAGVATVVVADWRLGTRVMAGSLLAAGAFRLLLRERDAGMLAVRNRFLDAALVLGAGTVLIFLASSIPNQPGG